MNRITAALTAALLALSVTAVTRPAQSAPNWVTQEQFAALEARVAALEARVAVLEGGTSSTTTSTTTSVPATSTTTASTSTTAPTTTSTLPSTTSSTVAASTTTSTLAPSTTSSSTGGTGETINLTGDWTITGHDTRTNFTVNGNGHQILIDGGTVDWSAFTIDNVSRVMFTNCAGPSRLADGEVSNAGGPDLGFYPLHWHLNGDCTRGTVVERVTVRDSAHRGFVPHGSHGITFTDINAFNIKGEAFWWDPTGTDCPTPRDTAECTLNNSNDIVVDRLTVDGVSNGPGDTRGFQLTAVRLGAGSGNSIRNSTVSNVHPSHKDVCSAYHWPADANFNKGGNVWVFENNHGTSDCNGIFVWQNDNNTHIVDGFTGGGIEHGAYGNHYLYRNVDVPFLIVHAQGWEIEDSSVGAIDVRDHRADNLTTIPFRNVDATSVVFNDALGQSGIRLDFTGPTTLTCADVNYANPHPDSLVIINGVVCG